MDHKHLVPVLSTKHLDRLPPRVLRFRLRLARFHYSIRHVPSKLLYVADVLSRAPIADAGKVSQHFGEEVEVYVEEVVSNLPASKTRLDVYHQAQTQDTVCAKVQEYCRTGWPKRKPEEPELVPYWQARNMLTLHDNLLLYGHRIVVPPSLQKEMLAKIHEGHQGITRCQMRTRGSVWWPGIMQQIKQKVEQCQSCAKEARPRKEPLMITPLPDYP